MKKVFAGYEKFQKYFYEEREHISRSNLYNLRILSGVGTLVMTLFVITAPYVVPGWGISMYHLAFIPMFLLVFLATVLFRINNIKNVMAIRTLTLFSCSLMSIMFLVINILPGNNHPDTYFCLWTVIMPVIVIVRPEVNVAFSVLGSAIYLIFSCNLKEQSAIEHDIITVIAAMVTSMIVSIIMNKMRVNFYCINKKLEEISRTDLLTNTYNKVSFDDMCKRIYEIAGATNNNAFLIADIDNFKDINDGFGHQKGDEVIKRVSEALSTSVREGDVVGRIGGDEFAILMLNVHDMEQVKYIAERIIREVKNITNGVIEKEVTISIGGVVIGEGKSIYSDVFSKADKALYMVKAAGKNNHLIVA